MPLIRKTTGAPAIAPADAAAVLAALANGTADERWAAARTISTQPGNVQALGSALAQEHDARVREAIFTGLARIASAESIELIIPFIRSDDAQLRTGALDALRSMKSVVAPYMQRLFKDTDADVRLLACEIARELPGQDATRLLCDLLETESEANVCASAVEVLAEIGAPAALPVLARCAQRFADTPFLVFSIKITADRIRSQPSQPRG